MTYEYMEIKHIGGREVEVKTYSPYPSPWNNSSLPRPIDYYEKQSKILTYHNADGHKIEIHIPKASAGMNRKRVMTVDVNSQPFHFKNNSLLDMGLWFEIHELNQFYFEGTQPLQAISPFIYLYDNPHDAERVFNKRINGDVFDILHYYVEEMAKLKDHGLARDLLIPVNTRGTPHHWFLCVLSIDKNDSASLRYIESANVVDEYGKSYFEYYMNEVDIHLLTRINFILNEFQYQPIQEILYSQAKEFSFNGCGFALQKNIMNVLNRQFPELIPISNIEQSNTRKLTSSITIEEDAIFRVDLAFKMHFRDTLVESQQVTTDLTQLKNLYCRQILTHQYALKTKAKEAFSSSAEKNCKLSIC